MTPTKTNRVRFYYTLAGPGDVCFPHQLVLSLFLSCTRSRTHSHTLSVIPPLCVCAVTTAVGQKQVKRRKKANKGGPASGVGAAAGAGAGGSGSGAFAGGRRPTCEQVLVQLGVPSQEPPTFVTAQAPASRLPARSLCAVCGFTAPQSCVKCGTRVCGSKCLATHTETRCLKFVK
jgi:hypothetical protein